MTEPTQEQDSRFEMATAEALKGTDPTSQVSRYDQVRVEKLRTTAPKGEASDGTVEQGLKAAELDEAELANELRPKFFRAVVVAMCGVLLASVAIMAFYMWSEWGEIDSAVMISWMSATVVQTIGLAYIIAKYLFPAEKEKGQGA